MIRVTRLDGTTVLVNVDQIESIEETPDTIVSLTNGHKIITQETSHELVERVVEFRRRIGLNAPSTAPGGDHVVPLVARGRS